MPLPTAIRILFSVLPLLAAAAAFHLFGGDPTLAAVVGAALAVAALALGARQLHLAVQTARWNAGHRVR